MVHPPNVNPWQDEFKCVSVSNSLKLSKTGNKNVQFVSKYCKLSSWKAISCVVYLTGYILEHLDRQMSTGALFIDLKKASNLVDYECLLFKLTLNTSEEAVWIDSWTVLPHELRVQFEMTCSPVESCEFGVPLKEEGAARGRHARGEGAPARDAYHDLSPRFQLPGGRCVICQKCWDNAIGLAQTKRAKVLYIYILGLNISVIKIFIYRAMEQYTDDKQTEINYF